ncbi:predicted protein [Phaeodactylum tricornutum CCAP 1055/1]|uniref:C2 DOCK-type domain-containing protein n=1 Tax=Phaeodactylum tricornutum (strain CCAP 1055/1) TaxID=556484 RepID=B5Y5A7_PHATC|nr:predicted protein [Phaeodactylum tricornutum CCAP 1055/1]ACI65622.1 predicted protein [Phaeodactylum tricornutum CCAP 1055/1]|eukprot:XP_002186152.1 predicted protein [Phaeodactylum tricornutum CCAP 1055/1]
MADDEVRRKNEISAFAAMALGANNAADDDDNGSGDRPNTTRSGSVHFSQPSTLESSSEGVTAAVNQSDEPQNIFADAVAQAEDRTPSGTFAFSKASHKHAMAERSNLEAAAAALADGDPATEGAQANFPAPPLTSPLPQPPTRKPVEDVPMFAEQVIMPKPLFFGPILPPRVVLQARKMVVDAQRSLGYDPTSNDIPPRLSELPPGVRNLVGALRVYGHGIDVLEPIDEDSEFWRGDGTVRTFQPVWDETSRNERVHEHRKRQRPEAISRASTAPARLWQETESEKTEDSEESLTDLEAPMTPNGLSKNEQFSMWLRADDDSIEHLSAGSPRDMTESIVSVRSVESLHSPARLPEVPLLENSAHPSSSTAPQHPLSDQALFSRWARGGASMAANDSSRSLADSTDNVSAPGTFHRIPILSPLDDSDDDSVNYDESKKKVGANDHLTKAVASFGGDQPLPAYGLVAAETNSRTLLSQVPLNETQKRPLTNYELTNGRVPLFGVDDPPLPSEADLGAHDSKEEQARSYEQKRSQDIIARFVAPNVFGSIACPNPAMHPDDFHSWNARATIGSINQRIQNGGARSAAASVASDGLSLPSLLPHVRRPLQQNGSLSQKPKKPNGRKQYVSRSRYGWWNVAEEDDEGKEKFSKRDGAKIKEESSIVQEENPMLLPPVHHSSSALQVVTLLEPSPEDLHKENLPLSRMHAATSMAQSLPYISDRPPNYRYLQIDAQAVGFPPMGAEVEPLFCKLSIYNVETTTNEAAGNASATPTPNFSRCGRVTEGLHFDVVSDEEVAERCHAALWPYSTSSPQSKMLRPRGESHEPERLQGTRCGVFPLPSTLNNDSLYAVLVVHKVFSDDGDVAPYLKASKVATDVGKLKVHAERASNRHGALLMPFAFGVAPLLQVFGIDNPVVASSRAVQIPLFRYSPGLGERQIVDHIMVMLFPKAAHRVDGLSGPAAVTNGGAAMLVMRNFGYLGLHSVVDPKSSLARDRLVDFTGELQLRRRADEKKDQDITKSVKHDAYLNRLPSWHSQYSAEPTVNGGRNSDYVPGNESEKCEDHSLLYAQELAPLPLQFHGVESFYNTSFYNELLFHPRMLHNCPKGNTVIKVELRELEWNKKYGVFLAHLPECGPSIHNNRRGPSLVQSSFSSCSPRGSGPNFVDEFKLKLPLDLQTRRGERTGALALLFTVYHVKVSSRTKWSKRAKMIFGTTHPADSAGEQEELESVEKSRLKQIACGFLTIGSQASVIDNGTHDVRVSYTAKHPPTEITDQGIIDPGGLVLIEQGEGNDGILPSFDGPYDSCAETSVVSNDSWISDRLTHEVTRTDASIASASDLASIAEDSSTIGSKAMAATEISLSVRVIVHSSVHPQNETIARFLQNEPELPCRPLIPSGLFLSSIAMGRDFLRDQAELRSAHQSEADLVKLTVDIADKRCCPFSCSASHLLRLSASLWRSLAFGSGKPDLVWANPSAVIPLRVESFASLMGIVCSAAITCSKRGITQVDGVTKLSVVALGRVLALVFDEERLFAEQAVEVFDQSHYSFEDSSQYQKRQNHSYKKTPKKGRHVRQNFALLNNDTSGRQNNQKNLTFPGKKADLVDFRQGTVTVPLSAQVSDMGESTKDSTWNPVKSDEGSSKSSSSTHEHKVDSKSDFQSALRIATSEDDSDISIENTGVKRAAAMIQAFNGASRGNRKWMTAPAIALSTIKESEDADANDSEIFEERQQMKLSSYSRDSLDDEIVLNSDNKVRPKQMRVPKVQKSEVSNVIGTSTVIETPTELSKANIPQSDLEIERAGVAFLDVIGKSLGLSNQSHELSISSSDAQAMVGEERRVGSSHHRKTQSRSSIDWTLKGEEFGSISQDAQLDMRGEAPKDTNEEHAEAMSTLQREDGNSCQLPDYVDRLVAFGRSSSRSGRWFPYIYEIIIMQWAGILSQQSGQGEKPRRENPGEAPKNFSVPSGDDNLNEVAFRALGVAVASAPLLFEVIKKSLGFRVSRLFNHELSKSNRNVCPPLVELDKTLFGTLEQIISMLTDACIDSRNFDSLDHRQMSFDVNDSIIRFLRDMFSFLTPSTVYRLILTHLSRFLAKDGKNWQDRDSDIGLRCSWEVAKLRLNTITALVRFPDFVRVNSPQMLNWGDWWTRAPVLTTATFFDAVLSKFEKFRLPDLVDSEGLMQSSKATGVSNNAHLRPHWLAELVIDICLLGSEHAEQYIQNRSSSLVHELLWSCSQESVLAERATAVASMYATLLEKLLQRINYLSSFAPKSQLRIDLLTSAIYVLQSAPPHLLRALWRKLLSRLRGKGSLDKYCLCNKSSSLGGLAVDEENQGRLPKGTVELKEEADVLDMFCLLNLALKTAEYEGCEEHLEGDSAADGRDSIEVWRRAYLLAHSQCGDRSSDAQERNSFESRRQQSVADSSYSSSISRKWQAHDGSIVIVNTGHQINMELYHILSATIDGQSLLNPAIYSKIRKHSGIRPIACSLMLSYVDVVVFVRASTSLYLHALALKQSDIGIIRTFQLSGEVIKIFGIKLFLDAVGETLQHWMRVISFQCGARRANVRVEATDLLELILRSTWECFGSFFRIRVPLLAVQTEVMERIVATAAARFYRDQRRLRTAVDTFSNISAEASLVPLWRTLDRIEKQPASQNIAFRVALIRMSQKLKKLYRAYIGARVLSCIQGTAASKDLEDDEVVHDYETEGLLRANRINVLRVINASEGHSKQFLGFQGTHRTTSRVAHYEAVEDAFIDAADVFSATELPEHRVAWLQMLADFHASRSKSAEEATCHFFIHLTYQQAAPLHRSLWSSTAFLPWTDNMPDPVYIDGDNPTVDPDYTSDYDLEEASGNLGRDANSFRRIFYRVANSVGVENTEWQNSLSKTLFGGIAFSIEYHTLRPWISLRKMEENMVEEAEGAGELFLKAGIVESSRLAWNLATQYYAEKFNYGKLSVVYRHLAQTVVSEVPPIDTSLPQEMSATLGRFYRVWFHGGAPDELSGVEFVYRADSSVALDQFGEELRGVIKSIIPDKTPIHLVLDGRPESRLEEGNISLGFSRIGPAPLEPVRIKVTPLRPMLGNSSHMRGLPEWFHSYVSESFSGLSHRPMSERNRGGLRRSESIASENGDRRRDIRHRDHARSFSASVFSSGGSSAAGTPTARRNPIGRVHDGDRLMRFSNPAVSVLAGVDKFCFVQPKDRSSKAKDWWKSSSGDFAEKSLKVTQLQVGQQFPACVTRQAVVHRLVYSQSPLEAGVDSVCQWCAVLFRTAVATVGMAVIRTNTDPGIGNDAAKIVADCIHSSHVKEIGLALLKRNSDFPEHDPNSDFLTDNDRLSDEEIKKLQVKLARLIVVFVELLHLLIARNRDILLGVIKDRKKSDNSMAETGSGNRSFHRTASLGPTVSDSIDRHPRSNIHQQRYPHQRHDSQGNMHDFSALQPSSSVPPLGPPRWRRQQHTDQTDTAPHHTRSQTDGGATRSGEFRSNRSDTDSRGAGRYKGQNPSVEHLSTDSGSNSGGAVFRTDSAIAVQSELQRAFISMRTEIPIAQELCFATGGDSSVFIDAENASATGGTLKSLSDSNWPGVQTQHPFYDGSQHESLAGGSDRGSVVSRGSEPYGISLI